MNNYVKFFDEKINEELAKNAGYIRCMDSYKKCKEFVQYFKTVYPRLRNYIAGSITPTSINAQSWKQMLEKSKPNEISNAEYQIRYFWYDEKQKKLWRERLETTKLFYDEVERFIENDQANAVILEKLEKKTAKNMAIIEKHICRKVICANVDSPELKDLVDDLVSERNAKAGTFVGYMKEILQEEIAYAKLQQSGKTNTTLEVIKGIKETSMKKK